jgi:hypothetical protein
VVRKAINIVINSDLLSTSQVVVADVCLSSTAVVGGTEQTVGRDRKHSVLAEEVADIGLAVRDKMMVVALEQLVHTVAVEDILEPQVGSPQWGNLVSRMVPEVVGALCQ